MLRSSVLGSRLVLRFVFLLSFLSTFPALLQAQVVLAPPPTVGSSNPVSSEPPVTRPPTTPCKVALFQNLKFNDFNERTYSYTPPAACPAPWAKVVFSMDLTVTAGIQYDRSSQIYLNNVTLFRGTTAEPAPGFSPSWHVESDVTDLSAAFAAASNGVANIQNPVNSTDNGIIYANAELDFYPVGPGAPAAIVPDQVVPVYNNGDAYHFYTPASPLSEAITLPKNTIGLYLDVIAQADEFWWFSTPNAEAAPYLGQVDATALREMDISIDGTPAGVAPNHPYIFTGGIDPDLWIPIPGAQTLNLKPYRVNLTPFAGVFDDGNPHTISINDINTQGSSLVNGNLLIYTDHGAATVTGAVVSNTLGPNPGTTVVSNVDLDANGNGEAQVTESLERSFAISGYVNTSQGKVTTTVAETVNFVNAQQLVNVSSPVNNVNVDTLTSTVDATVTTQTPSATSVVQEHTENPLQLTLSYEQNTDGSQAESTTFDLRDVYRTQGPGSYASDAEEEVTSTDTLNFDANGNFTGNTGQASTGTYFATDSLGNDYTSALTATHNVLTGVAGGSSSAAVTLLLSASATTAVQGSSVTLSATVTPLNNTQTPGGYVTFYANGTVLGTVAVANKSANLAVTTLAVGANAITASYTGDLNFNAATGVNAVTVTVTALTPGFTLGAAAPASLPLVAGTTGVATLPIAANASFSGTVTFACAGVPAETNCTVNPGTVALTAGQTASVSVVIATTAPNNNTGAENRMPALSTAVGGVSVAGLLLLTLPRRRRFGVRLPTLLAIALLGLSGMAALTGCAGKGGPAFPGTPSGTSTITVTASSGNVSQSASFQVVVTQ